jgi:hypothetical protein
MGLGGRKRKVSLIKNDVSRDDDLASGEVKTPVALLRRRVTEEKTHAMERGDNLWRVVALRFG